MLPINKFFSNALVPSVDGILRKLQVSRASSEDCLAKSPEMEVPCVGILLLCSRLGIKPQGGQRFRP